MAQPFSDTPKAGVDLNSVILAADITSGVASGRTHRLGAEAFGTDGKRYVYGQANAAITAGTTVVTLSPTTFLATATGGAYKSPAVAMATGDQGWFGAASV